MASAATTPREGRSLSVPPFSRLHHRNPPRARTVGPGRERVSVRADGAVGFVHAGIGGLRRGAAPSAAFPRGLALIWPGGREGAGSHINRTTKEMEMQTASNTGARTGRSPATSRTWLPTPRSC
jgi:hypothetical protein